MAMGAHRLSRQEAMNDGCKPVRSSKCRLALQRMRSAEDAGEPQSLDYQHTEEEAP
jgi:hypothetical protein